MIYPKFQVWFALAALVAPTMAFSPSKPPSVPGTDSPLASSVSQEFNREEIDISGVMSEVESALQLASESMPVSTESIEGELAKFSEEMDLKGKLGEMQEVWKNSDDKTQMVATAVAGSTLGVLAGSPLVLGAALGMAGTQLLDDSEEGLKNRAILEKADHWQVYVNLAHVLIQKVI